MSVKIFRRGSARCIGLFSAFLTIIVCLYYISIGQSSSSSSSKDFRNKRLIGSIDLSSQFNYTWQNAVDTSSGGQQQQHQFQSSSDVAQQQQQQQQNELKASSTSVNKCYELGQTRTDITTMDEYSKFDFQPEWMKTKEYWDKTFELRYEKLKKNTTRPPLKVIIVPHSHNDPGWLKTFMNYFQSDSKQILNLIITKMQEYKDMTFIWSEISYLQLWWDQAHPTKQRALKQLIQSGRFEITTGGWVMTDEANVHVYAMVDQLIEGHQWVKTNLNYTPDTGWSIDPFGHGSTVPYLLAASGFHGTIIQRIHYAWKQWFAKNQAGDFLWKPYWSSNQELGNQEAASTQMENTLLTHNMPFDIYSIKHSCGPHPFVCLNFDFRKIPGEYTEYSIKAQFITDDNIEAKADLLMEQYSRTASLFPHNVALIPVGDDFRYNKEREIEQQYTNYKKLIDYINNHKDRYHTEIGFGLPKDYFQAIRERTKRFPSLKGDFFVYSDIFTEGRPAYWSGYYTTRPLYKILSRELEHNLRCLEILFSVAFNQARQTKNQNALRIFEKNYEKMILARRNLGLFQHHDAITGTSKAAVMRDYGIRLFESIQDVVKLQGNAIELLAQQPRQKELNSPPTAPHSTEHNFVISELERESFNKLSKKSPIIVQANKSSKFVVFNSLAQDRIEIIAIRTLIPNVQVHDSRGRLLEIQINPVWNISDGMSTGDAINLSLQTKIRVSDRQFEILFAVRLGALTLETFSISMVERVTDGGAASTATVADYRTRLATLYCNDCKDENHNIFQVKNKQPGDIQLENHHHRLLFDEQTGFLKVISKKDMGRPIQCAIKFAAYRSAQFHSGAYLFKTDPEHREAEKDVLEQYSDVKILITSGPIASDVTVIYGPFLAHTVRVYNTKMDIDRAIYIENDIDFEPPPKNRETELFMRIQTDIENGEIPEIYTDQNAFQYHKRIKVPTIGVEGNYYPITSAAFIQDERLRLTLLTTHAEGAASLEPGQLEVMLDRRTLYDDYRGMGEGVVDSRQTRHKFWLLLEEFQKVDGKSADSDGYQVPTLYSNQLGNALNYPANIYFVENQDAAITANWMNTVSLLRGEFPCDLHLMTLRTLTETELPLFPSRSALMVLHRQGFSCAFKGAAAVAAENGRCTNGHGGSVSTDSFQRVKVESISSTSLTGLMNKESIIDFTTVQIQPMDIRTFNWTFAN